jgi:hypothetical protein
VRTCTALCKLPVYNAVQDICARVYAEDGCIEFDVTSFFGV